MPELWPQKRNTDQRDAGGVKVIGANAIYRRHKCRCLYIVEKDREGYPEQATTDSTTV